MALFELVCILTRDMYDMDVLFEVNADASKTREQSHTYTHVQLWPLFGFKAISTTLLRSILKYSHENAHAILFI